MITIDNSSTIVRDGRRFRYEAGPFNDMIDALDYAALLVERQALRDKNVLIERSRVYVAADEDVLA